MSSLSDRLAKMPPDRRRATLSSLPKHLVEATQTKRLHLLLTDFDFVEAKISVAQ